jgi:hypothetical protein
MPSVSLVLGILGLILNPLIYLFMALKTGWIFSCLVAAGVLCALAAIILSIICICVQQKSVIKDDRPVWSLVTGIFSLYFTAWTWFCFNPF